MESQAFVHKEAFVFVFCATLEKGKPIFSVCLVGQHGKHINITNLNLAGGSDVGCVMHCGIVWQYQNRDCQKRQRYIRNSMTMSPEPDSSKTIIYWF